MFKSLFGAPAVDVASDSTALVPYSEPAAPTFDDGARYVGESSGDIPVTPLTRVDDGGPGVVDAQWSPAPAFDDGARYLGGPEPSSVPAPSTPLRSAEPIVGTHSRVPAGAPSSSAHDRHYIDMNSGVCPGYAEPTKQCRSASCPGLCPLHRDINYQYGAHRGNW